MGLYGRVITSEPEEPREQLDTELQRILPCSLLDLIGVKKTVRFGPPLDLILTF